LPSLHHLQGDQSWVHLVSKLGRSQTHNCFKCTLSKQKCLIDRALAKEDFEEQLLIPRFDFTRNTSSDEEMAIDEVGSNSDVLDASNGALVASIVSFDSSIAPLRSLRSTRLPPLSRLP